jgi:hypothetical protein
VGASSGALETKNCDTADPLQQFLYNVTTKNALPVGSRGFVQSPGSGTKCPVGTGTKGSNPGCCLTNNGMPLVLWGCCPYSPSECTNQRITAHDDGTLRNGALCVGRSSPPPAPVVTFDKLGAIDFESYESTPLVFNGKLLLMETISLAYPGHISHWEPQYAACSSYYRIRDLKSGVVIRNLTESCDHSFGSAFVDKLPNGTEVLWVFGSAWYRPRSSSSSSSLGHRGGVRLGWGGKCSSPANCTIDTFSTTDPTLQAWSRSTAIKPGRSTWNNDVTVRVDR